MKKLMTYLTAGVMALTMNSCMDLDSTSSITDTNYWKNADQFEASHVGLMGLFRENAYTFIEWGEMRSDIYAGTPFSGESPGSYRYMWDNTLSQQNPVISDFGGLYTYINQTNLLIGKTEESDVLTDAQRSKYLGAAYGMRAFYYFQLLRSYGDVVLYTDYTTGAKLNLSDIGREQSPAADVMKLIKEDIKKSEDAYNGNYAFTDGRTAWSLAATKMLKGEVYLWSGKQMGGGTTDYQTAKQAFLDVDNADVDLLDNFTDVFKFDNKNNKEIILAIYNGEKETALWNGYYSSTLVMQKAKVGSYYLDDPDSDDFYVKFADSDYKYHDGLMYVSLNSDMYDPDEEASRVYREGDSRSRATIQEVWTSNGSYAGVIAYKYHGTLLAGGSATSWYDDQPIYRYADCLLGLCEAKALLGEDISEDMNWVRERAYGKAYFESHPDVQYPNDKDAAFYDGNKFVGSDADPIEAVLKERMREFMFEGKRWYDIRLMDKATKYSSASSTRLLWPIDENALGENSKLHQTPGYETNVGK